MLRNTVLTILTTLFVVSVATTVEARIFEGADPLKSNQAQSVQDNSLAGQWSKLKKVVKVEAKKIWDKYRPKTEEEKRIEAERIAEQKRRQEEHARKVAEAKRVEDLRSQLPTYDTQNKNQFTNFVENTQRGIIDKPALKLANPGAPADSTLPKTKAGVAHLKQLNVKSISELNIGKEPTLSKSDFSLEDFTLNVNQLGLSQALKSPREISQVEFKDWVMANYPKAEGPLKEDRKKYGMAELVTEKKVIDVALEPKDLSLEKLMDLHKIDKDDLNLMAALILYARGGRCHSVIGLFHDLTTVKRHEVEARYHLGLCSIEVGFYTQAVKNLIAVMKSEHKHYAPLALTNLVKNLKKESEVEFAKAYLSLKDKNIFQKSYLNELDYRLAKGLFKMKKFKQAQAHAQLVKKDSELYPSAQYIHAVSYYALGNKSLAMKTLQELQSYIEANNINDTNLNTLLAVNLGRMQFRLKRYKEATLNYMKVAKNHQLWVQALIEQGWSQLMVGDYSGAIGNMYSLHSPYFKSVYMPESHVVRTIGYLNICQYGDAYSTLTSLENDHRNWYNQISSYIRKHKKAKDYYFTVINYLKGNSEQSVDGLPYQVIRELGRQRVFLNYQETLNSRVDELDQLSFIMRFINQDRAKLNRRIQLAKDRIVKLKQQIKSVETDGTKAKFLTEWNQQKAFETRLIDSLRFELKIITESKKAYGKFKSQATKKINRDIYKNRERGARFLVGHMKKMQSQIAKVLENNEFLRYEIYAGSGENIRYQVAGGKTGNRIPANVAPPKSLNWDFKGEYWADEIGSYRSTLKNNCPNSGRRSAALSGGVK